MIFMAATLVLIWAMYTAWLMHQLSIERTIHRALLRGMVENRKMAGDIRKIGAECSKRCRLDGCPGDQLLSLSEHDARIATHAT